MFFSDPFPSTNGVSLPNSFFDHEKDDVHSGYGDLLFHSYNSSTPPPDQFSEGSGLQHSVDHAHLLDSIISQCKKKTATSKKDGHTKIYTAQGPRDRRVRLSIEISRKFFCLQDLLGFDKASKTLDWLFTKSKIAIRELVEGTTHGSSSTLTDQSKVQFLETINNGSVEDEARKEKSVPKCLVAKKRKPMQRWKTGFRENLARDQSRAEARARARERTREKLRVKKLDNDLKTIVPDCCESGFWGQTELKMDYRGHHMGVHNGSRNFKV